MKYDNGSSINVDNYRKLSPHVQLVASLCSFRYNYTKSINGEIQNIGKIVGYRFKSTVDVKNIIRFDIIDGSKAYSTDPSAYRKNNVLNVRSGDYFDLNLFETMVFFMRDDICGEIYGNDFEVYLRTRSTGNDFISAFLAPKHSNCSVRENQIYIDMVVKGKVVPILNDFERYASIYEKKENKDKGIDKQAKTILNLRDRIDFNLWNL